MVQKHVVIIGSSAGAGQGINIQNLLCNSGFDVRLVKNPVVSGLI